MNRKILIVTWREKVIKKIIMDTFSEKVFNENTGVWGNSFHEGRVRILYQVVTSTGGLGYVSYDVAQILVQKPKEHYQGGQNLLLCLASFMSVGLFYT